MTNETFYEIFGEISQTYVEEAREGRRKKKKHMWVPWAAAAVIVAVVLSIVVLRGGILGNGREIVTLENGDTISFVKSGAVSAMSLQLPSDVLIRELTEEEIRVLFAGLPAEGKGVVFTGNGYKLAGFEGKIGNVKVVISTSGLRLLDTVIAGREESTQVKGVAVTAGYFVTSPNSRGEKNVIYYASFELGGSSIYVEGSGTQARSGAVREEAASVVWKLINNGEPDFAGISE